MKSLPPASCGWRSGLARPAAFWSTKKESGVYAGVPVDLGKEMAKQLGVPVDYVVFQNSGQITDSASKGGWDITFLPKDPERETKMSFGPIYIGRGYHLHHQGQFAGNELRDPRPARHKGRCRQPHHDHARCDRASEERQGDGLSDL